MKIFYILFEKKVEFLIYKKNWKMIILSGINSNVPATDFIYR